MKLVRSTKVSLKETNPRKLKVLEEVFREYGRIVNLFVELFWENPVEKSKLLKPIVDSVLPTWLSARLRKVAAREALDLILSAKRSAKALGKTPKKPTHRGNRMCVSSTIASLDLAGKATSYDRWLHLQSIGHHPEFGRIILDLPIKLHKHYNELASIGRRQESYILTLDDLLGGAEVADLDDLSETERWDVEDSLVERLTNAESIEELQAEVLALEQLMRRARAALGSGIEAKLIQLTDAILRDEGLAARGEKLLIFTEAKDTLTFLVSQLRAQGFKVAVIEGSLSMDQRRQQQEFFRGEAQIMVATEAGGESINLQFCNQMVNYDIPWNPNRLEQRMGRIHRIGQKNEVFIFNLVATDTREGAVLAALLRKMEEMRQGLGSDRVFDLVGDLLEDHEISLADLIIDCITNRRRLADAVASIEQAVSPDHQASLIAAREEGLARRFVNLPELRHEAARSASQALLPTHLESFFTHALERNRGRWDRRADGKLRVERVPINLRHEQELDFRRRYGTVQRAYLSLTFDKAAVGEDGRTELLGPGHPLFESVLQAAEAGFTDALARGAVFFDVDAEAPERLWFFRGVVGDGTGRILSQRLFAVRECEADGEATFAAAHPIRLHDLRPRSDGPPPAPLVDFDVRKHSATRFCLEHMVPHFVDEVASGRLKELGLKERYLERSFRVVISRHSDRLLDLEEKARAGQDMSLAIGREQRLMDEAKRRQQERLAEVRLEQQLVPRAPEFLGVVTVLPAEASVGAAKADDTLLARVSEVEASFGRSVDDARGEGLGFDAIARDADGQDVRFILARELDDESRLWLRSSEWAHAQHLGDRVVLYAAQNGQLATLLIKDAVAAAHVDELNRRVSIRLAGLQLPLATERDPRSEP